MRDPLLFLGQIKTNPQRFVPVSHFLDGHLQEGGIQTAVKLPDKAVRVGQHRPFGIASQKPEVALSGGQRQAAKSPSVFLGPFRPSFGGQFLPINGRLGCLQLQNVIGQPVHTVIFVNNLANCRADAESLVNVAEGIYQGQRTGAQLHKRRVRVHIHQIEPEGVGDDAAKLLTHFSLVLYCWLSG